MKREIKMKYAIVGDNSVAEVDTFSCGLGGGNVVEDLVIKIMGNHVELKGRLLKKGFNFQKETGNLEEVEDRYIEEGYLGFFDLITRTKRKYVLGWHFLKKREPFRMTMNNYSISTKK